MSAYTPITHTSMLRQKDSCPHCKLTSMGLPKHIESSHNLAHSLFEQHLSSRVLIEHHQFDMLTANSPPLVILKNVTSSYDTAFRIVHRWTVHLGQFLSQYLLDLQYRVLASGVIIRCLTHLDTVFFQCSNTALASSAALRWVKYSDAFNRTAVSAAQSATSVSILEYGAVLIVAGLVSAVPVFLAAIQLGSVPLVALWYVLRVNTCLSDMDRRKALENNSKACIILHPLPWEIRMIRIITIRPGLPGDSIMCDLRIGDFQTEEYEALSYVWGAANFTRKIFINGKRVYVTGQLYHAMKRLRYVDSCRSIWIDALCIDQSDPDDRARQVSQMRQIYESATRVVIWLGSSPWGLEDAFSRAQIRPQPIVHNYGTTRAVSKLLQRGWWQRVWVVQELVVASEVLVQCDFALLPWNNFVQLVDSCVKMPWFRDSGTFVDEYRALKHYRETKLQDTNPDYGLLSFVYAFRHKKASDPRDKIYAFLGLVLRRNQNAFAIPPDYKLSHTSLCHSFAINCIRETQSLNILVYAQGLDPDVPSVRGRRSWCPYWYSGTGTRLPMPLWDGDLDTPDMRPRWRQIFSASGRKSAAIWEPRENDALGAKGLFLETIIAVGTALNNSVLQSFDSDSSNSITIGPRTSFSRNQWYNIDRQSIFSKWQAMVISASGRPEEEVVKIFHQTLTAGLHDHIPDDIDQTNEYSSVRDEVCMHRTVFITESGGFGLGPWNTRRGDRLAILLGCDVPVVLRSINGTDSPAEPGLDIESLEAQNLYQIDLTDAYKYVGQAYVQDCMVYDGDLAKNVEQTGRTLDDITLL